MLTRSGVDSDNGSLNKIIVEELIGSLRRMIPLLAEISTASSKDFSEEEWRRMYDGIHDAMVRIELGFIYLIRTSKKMFHDVNLDNKEKIQ